MGVYRVLNKAIENDTIKFSNHFPEAQISSSSSKRTLKVPDLHGHMLRVIDGKNADAVAKPQSAMMARARIVPFSPDLDSTGNPTDQKYNRLMLMSERTYVLYKATQASGSEGETPAIAEEVKAKPQAEGSSDSPAYNCVVGAYQVTMPNADNSWSTDVVSVVQEAGGFETDTEAQLWLGATMVALIQGNPENANPHQMTEQYIRSSNSQGSLKAWGQGLSDLVGQQVQYNLFCPVK